MARRIETGVHREPALSLQVDGQTVSAFPGESLATVLLALGIEAFNRTRTGAPRGPFCNMGTCFECQVRVAEGAGAPMRWQRACLCPVEAGMVVLTAAPLADPGART